MDNIKLHSLKPLPMDADYLAWEAKLAKQSYDLARRAGDATPRKIAAAKKLYEATMAGLADVRTHPTKELATIEGLLITGTGRSIFDGLKGS